MARFPSKKEFANFLHQHANESVGSPTSPWDCPLARFVNAKGFIRASIAYEEVFWYKLIKGVMHCQESKLPKWADRFLSHFDDQPIREYTGEEVQNILKVATPAEVPNWLAFFAGAGIGTTIIGVILVINKLVYLLLH